MSPIFPGRYTAQIEGPFVMFIIGLLLGVAAMRLGKKLGRQPDAATSD